LLTGVKGVAKIQHKAAICARPVKYHSRYYRTFPAATKIAHAFWAWGASMRLKTALVLSSLSVPLLAGCAGVPALDPLGTGPKVSEIVDQIECEVYRASHAHPRLVKERWTAAIDLSLQVDDNVGLTPTVSFIDPASVAGFTFGASGVFKGARQRIYAEALDLHIKGKQPASCPDQPDSFDLTGSMGIVETVDLGMSSVGPNDQTTFKKDKAFGQTISFVVTKNVNAVGPNWKFARFEGPGGFFGAERIDTHQLVISFSPGAPVVTKTAAGVTTTIQYSAGGARNLNYQLLLKSLPTFRPAAR
jgi:hypothetical protein